MNLLRYKGRLRHEHARDAVIARLKRDERQKFLALESGAVLVHLSP